MLEKTIKSKYFQEEIVWKKGSNHEWSEIVQRQGDDYVCPHPSFVFHSSGRHYLRLTDQTLPGEKQHAHQGTSCHLPVSGDGVMACESVSLGSGVIL